MSNKELSRAEVMGRVKAGSLRLREAGELLELSYRQAKRIWARYREGGAKALQHGNCGQSSNRSHPKKFREAVLERVKSRYGDFGPTLAAEHLGEEEGLAVHAPTPDLAEDAVMRNSLPNGLGGRGHWLDMLGGGKGEVNAGLGST